MDVLVSTTNTMIMALLKREANQREGAASFSQNKNFLETCASTCIVVKALCNCGLLEVRVSNNYYEDDGVAASASAMSSYLKDMGLTNEIRNKQRELREGGTLMLFAKRNA